MKRPVAWADHERWFAESLVGDKRRVFIVTEEGEAVGQIRFDRVNVVEREVSVYLVPDRIGRGLGVVAIRLGCAEIRRSEPGTKLTAWIRAENNRSLRAFIRAGFAEDRVSEGKSGHVRMTLLLEAPLELGTPDGPTATRSAS